MIPHTNLRSITDEEISTISKKDNQCAENIQGCSRSASDNNDHSSIQRFQDDEYIKATTKRRKDKQLEQIELAYQEYMELLKMDVNLLDQHQQQQRLAELLMLLKISAPVNSIYLEQTDKSI
ncbi:Hypothetical_protein [Hexamita inflata]|uniref:Hypothetical_protein n=1 Tax=Hexamita inflata TaxID=28002 RepID=A0AA86UXB0_9EUKA|nr:Hypothetical protein HINF_LOCUS59339 [Hexamita inflata]